MNFFNKTKAFGIALLSMMSVAGMAQDLIASQAPSDKKLKEVKMVKLNNTVNADLNDPASDIYTNWTHDFWKLEGHVAANYKIDLRGFHMPTSSRIVTSNFGRRWGKQHQGLDIKVYTGDTIRAAFDGKVRVVTCEGLRKGYGYYIVIRHPNGLETLYGHLSKQLVKEDQIVRAGDVIGLGGSTGRSTGSHLHFETRLLGQPINPEFMFDFANQDVTADFYTARTGAITKGNIASTSIKEMEEEVARREGAQMVSTGVSALTQQTEAEEELALQPVNKKKSSTNDRKNQRTASYRVKDGDNLYNIAKRHGTTVAKLCKLNGISEKALLHKGQVLKTS